MEAIHLLLTLMEKYTEQMKNTIIYLKKAYDLVIREVICDARNLNKKKVIAKWGSDYDNNNFRGDLISSYCRFMLRTSSVPLSVCINYIDFKRTRVVKRVSFDK